MGKRIYAGDFETTTDKENCRVWAWAISEVGEPDDIYIGTDIDEFMFFCESRIDNLEVWFHNLKFDGTYILNWLLDNGFTPVTKSEDRASKTFKTMISDKGAFYGIEVIFHRRGKNIKKVTFHDSMKLLPMSVEEVAEAFHMPIKKGKIDYSAHNNAPVGQPLTKEEIEYITTDVKIMSIALGELRNMGLGKITIGACAMAEYIGTIGQRTFKRWFPNLKYHDDIRQAYRGGFTYVSPKFAEKKAGKGVVLDVNGLFPWALRYCVLPYGRPIFYKGKYEPDAMYPLYIQMIRCQCELKPGKTPTVQVKHSPYFNSTEYITSSNYEEITLCLTSVDLELFLEHYDVYNLEYISGWKFMGQTGMFDKYIDKWQEAKRIAKESKNWGLYLIAKLFLNALYGKFGTSTRRKSKTPYKDKDGSVRFKDEAPEEIEGGYVALAAFVTSYARRKTIGAITQITEDYESGRSKIQFAYCDTDSVHCVSEDFSLPECLEVDKYKLGAFKFESKFKRAKWLRAKCYIEDSTEDVYSENPEYKLKVTVGGLPKACHDQITFDNFKVGATYTGKKQPVSVNGGIVLRDIDFTIKR